MNITPEIHALLISPDVDMSVVFSRMFNEIGVATQSCEDESLAPGLLSTSKFEALVLDFDNVSSGVPIITKLRENSSSKDAIIFAVATEVSDRQSAFAHGANFAFERPFPLRMIRQALETAYALMLRDRRRYFRCPIQTPVEITRASGEKVRAVSINISGNGMAVNVPSILNVSERLILSFCVTEADLTLDGFGTVVWDDKHGKAGLSFECASLDSGKRLAAWLDAQFYRRLKLSGGDVRSLP